MTPRFQVALAGLALLLGARAAHAQEPPCGIHTITETVAPIYPPIAKAAHVMGNVMLLITLEHDGSVSDAQVIRGPEMLRESTVKFVKGWKANEYGGSRACPVTVRFTLSGSVCLDTVEPATEKTRRVDSQHYVVVAENVMLCDPAATYTRRKRFLGIF